MKKLLSGIKDGLKSTIVLRRISIFLLVMNAAMLVVVLSYLTFSKVNVLLDKRKQEKSEQLCLQTYDTLCMKAFDCGMSSTINECDDMVRKQGFCHGKKFPPNDLILECEKQIRELTCEDDIPKTCMTFME